MTSDNILKTKVGSIDVVLLSDRGELSIKHKKELYRYRQLTPQENLLMSTLMPALGHFASYEFLYDVMTDKQQKKPILDQKFYDRVYNLVNYLKRKLAGTKLGLKNRRQFGIELIDKTKDSKRYGPHLD